MANGGQIITVGRLGLLASALDKFGIAGTTVLAVVNCSGLDSNSADLADVKDTSLIPNAEAGLPCACIAAQWA